MTEAAPATQVRHKTPPSRSVANTLAIVGIASTLALVPTSAFSAPPLRSALPTIHNTCPAPGAYPHVTSSPNAWYIGDHNANVYVSGNYQLGSGVAEVEGRLVVGNNAAFSHTTPTLFLGTAVGSWILPEPESTIVQVGGTIDANTTPIALAPEFGNLGAFAVAKDYTAGSVEKFLPHTTDGSPMPSATRATEPLGAFASYSALLPQTSTTLGALTPTHTTESGTRFGSPTTVFRVAEDSSEPAVFSIAASILATDIEFDVPATRPVIITF